MVSWLYSLCLNHTRSISQPFYIPNKWLGSAGSRSQTLPHATPHKICSCSPYTTIIDKLYLLHCNSRSRCQHVMKPCRPSITVLRTTRHTPRAISPLLLLLLWLWLCRARNVKGNSGGRDDRASPGSSHGGLSDAREDAGCARRVRFLRVRRRFHLDHSVRRGARANVSRARTIFAGPRQSTRLIDTPHYLNTSLFELVLLSGRECDRC